MNISIKDLIHKYATGINKEWKHDRSKTVGASAIGKCARQTWFDKNNAPRDEGYVDGWGAALRGTIIEDAFWVPALRATLPEGAELLFAGDEQETIVEGYLSATTDGLLVFMDGTSINLDCKSIDPRADISKEKSAHHFQVVTQMGLIRDWTEYKPEYTILSYVNASFFDEITEFVIPFNPRIYAQAHKRATQIMTARDALELPPEGKMAGGQDECRYCPWQSHCADVTVAGVPQSEKELDEQGVATLKHLRDCERELSQRKEEVAAGHAEAVEAIKHFLRESNTKRYRGDDWSVSYSTSSGRGTLDVAAAEAAGVDLSGYRKQGRASERLVVR
jgi:hypothetical protein